jgi:predicted metallo-beta-lactamase superfamily hydrolase
MKVGAIEVTPLAAESMGVRSLCTKVETPDTTIILDPSAALAKRHGLEPHPFEYQKLVEVLESIFMESRKADILSISHYHYDHVRPGFTNYRYNFSSREELQRLFEDKLVFAKDYREKINPSQRRRGHYFKKDVSGVAKEIRWADNKQFTFGHTSISYSQPLPHGPANTRMGYVLATIIEYGETRIVFAPDVQGPVVSNTLDFLLSCNATVLIVGGPPIYLSQWAQSDSNIALNALSKLAVSTPTLVIDHHLMRSNEWKQWVQPILNASSAKENKVLTMAELANREVRCMEAERSELYISAPPSEDFMNWAKASDEYKIHNMPPLE